MTAVLAVANVKGGVGKSTTAVQVALHAGARGVEVLLVDADPGRSALSWSTRAGDAWPGNVTVVPYPYADLLARLAAWASYDLIVIDTPHSPTEGTDVGPLVAAALSVADLVLVPTSPSPADIDRLVDMRAAIQREQAVRPLTWALVFTRVDLRSRTMLESRRAQVLERDLPLVDVVVPQRAAVAASFGTADVRVEYAPLVDQVMLQLAGLGTR